MKEAMWGYMIVILGIFVTVVMMIIRDYQTTNDQDYYLLKEITAAAMTDSIDYGYYREHNDLRIIEEKFVENFLRRFAQTMSSNKTYQIEMFRVNEVPPLATIKVTTATGAVQVEQDAEQVDFGVVSLMSGILDMKYDNYVQYDNYTYVEQDTPDYGLPDFDDDDYNTDYDEDDYNLDGTLPTCNVSSTSDTTYKGNYSSVVYKTYDQSDTRWASTTYKSGGKTVTVKDNGCMISAISTVLSGYDSSIDPSTLVNLGLATETPSFTTMILGGGNHGIECSPFQSNGTSYVSKSSILSELQNGNPAIIQVYGSSKGGSSKFTSTQHYMAILDYKVIGGIDYVYVGNSSSKASYGAAGWYKASEVFTSVQSMVQCYVSNELKEKCE